MNFYRTPFFLPSFYPSLLWRMPTEKRELYLTFDDGPLPNITEFVLNELRRVNAQATFFCIGDNVHKHPAVFEKITNENHTIGNHTFNHLKGWNVSCETYVQNVWRCREQMKVSNKKENSISNLFRPPYGRITKSQIKALQPNYKIVMWDVLTHDYAKNSSPESCLRGSLQATRPGSIIVFHDSLKAEKNMTFVLPRLLDHFAGKGFVFKSLN